MVSSIRLYVCVCLTLQEISDFMVRQVLTCVSVYAWKSVTLIYTDWTSVKTFYSNNRIIVLELYQQQEDSIYKLLN